MCANGFYQNLTGQTECLICPLGHECPRVDTPIPCTAGYVQDELGQIKCLECQVGHFCPHNAADKRYNCTYGHFSDEETSTECKVCPEGYFTRNERRHFTLIKKIKMDFKGRQAKLTVLPVQAVHFVTMVDPKPARFQKYAPSAQKRKQILKV